MQIKICETSCSELWAPTVIFRPIVHYTFIGIPAYHPLPGKCGVANARIRVLLAELNVPLLRTTAQYRARKSSLKNYANNFHNLRELLFKILHIS